MEFEKDLKILIVGLGLIGGSYARALKKRGNPVYAVTRSPETIEYALKKGWIDDGGTSPEAPYVSEADVVVFALYPHVFVDWIEKYQRFLKPGAILTDVTGVKGTLVEEIGKILRPDVEFIAAHPMAGRELSGIEHATDRIFRGANYIVVPTDKNTPRAVELCKALGKALGFADISVLSPAEHDDMIAFLSQLTHCIAVSLMCTSDDPKISHYTGNSFRDLTRIARLNDEMWSELFLCNRKALLGQMDAFRAAFDKLYGTIQSGDRETMREMMRLSTARRIGFDQEERKETV